MKKHTPSKKPNSKTTHKFMVISKDNFSAFVNKIIKTRKYRVVGVVPKDTRYAFADIDDACELCLDYDVTLLPPKKYLYPQNESYLKYKLNGDWSANPIIESKQTIIIGAHPYDIKAIELMDKVFSEPYPDPNYLQKRKDSVIIGVDCLNPSPYAFNKSMNTNIITSGFDLLLTDIGNVYMVEVGSNKGTELMRKYAKAKKSDEEDFLLRDYARKKASEKYQLSIENGVKGLASLLTEKNYDHPYWTEIAEKCLACGSCTMVCPTCVCFDVQDTMNVNMKEGERYRQWDSCMVYDFAKVATGENFREHRSSRTRHRMYRKGKFMLEKFGVQGCVGCGRCIRACLPDIASPVEASKRLKGDK